MKDTIQQILKHTYPDSKLLNKERKVLEREKKEGIRNPELQPRQDRVQ